MIYVYVAAGAIIVFCLGMAVGSTILGAKIWEDQQKEKAVLMEKLGIRDED